MSLAVDASSPTAAIGSGATTVTAAFTPPDNTLLVAFCQGDANNGSLDEDQTVTDSTSTTWTKKVLHNANGGACATVHYRRLSGTGSSPGSITATLTDTKGSVAKRIFVRVFVDAATGIAPDIGATAVSATASVSVTTTVNNSWVWSTGLTANATLTAGTGCTLQDNFGGFDSGDAVFTESQTSLTTTSGTSVTNAIAGTATVPHNIAVEIIPGSAGTSTGTPGPTVVTTTAPPARTAPIVLRSTLQDPPVLTTPGPLVVTSTRRAPVPPVALLRATLADPPVLTTPQPLVVSQPARFTPGSAQALRSTLIDAVVVTGTPTPPPLVVTPIPKTVPVPPVYTLRATLADPTPQTTPGPVVVSPTVRTAPTQVLLLRGSLFDPTTPGPYVVTTTARAPVPPVLLLRSSLFDPTTPGPYVVSTTTRSTVNPVLLLRSPAAPAVVASTTSAQPYIVTSQPTRSRGTVLLLAGSVGSCDCLVHRPNTGTVTRGSTGTVTRPNTGVVTRPCSC